MNVVMMNRASRRANDSMLEAVDLIHFMGCVSFFSYRLHVQQAVILLVELQAALPVLKDSFANRLRPLLKYAHQATTVKIALPVVPNVKRDSGKPTWPLCQGMYYSKAGATNFCV